MLTQDVLSRLENCSSVLLAGVGGGYDIAGAIPLALALRDVGKEVHLASLSFMDLRPREGIAVIEAIPILNRVDAEAASESHYCPEAWISDWLLKEHRWNCPIWCFQRSGVKPLHQAYEYLKEQLDLDAIILIDGGIDLILRGDETFIGTPCEDLVSLSAVAKLAVPVKMVACVGLGAELRDRIPHAQVLERIAALTQVGAFLGTASLAGDSRARNRYQDALDCVFGHQLAQKRSHVHGVILRSLKGEFGAKEGEQDVWISPLLAFYWYFELDAIASSHLFLKELDWTEEFLEVVRFIEGLRRNVRVRGPSKIPI